MEMSEYGAKERLAKAAERLTKSGVYAMTPEEVEYVLREAAYRLKVDLGKADLEETRRILSRGTPLSQVIREMRER